MTLQTIRESLSVSRLTVETIHLHVSHVLDMVREVKGLFFLAQDEGTDVEALADRIEEIRNHTYGFINKQINEQHYLRTIYGKGPYDLHDIEFASGLNTDGSLAVMGLPVQSFKMASNLSYLH